MSEANLGYLWVVHLESENDDELFPMHVVAETAECAIRIACSFAACETGDKFFTAKSVNREHEVHAVEVNGVSAIARAGIEAVGA